MRPTVEKHRQSLPSPRQIRRTCNKELYRTIKRLKVWIAPGKIAEAENRYYKKVIMNLIWITENGSNRKKLSDWFEQEVAPDIALLWEIDAGRIAHAFRDAFGG